MAFYNKRQKGYCTMVEEAIPRYLPQNDPLYEPLTEAMTYACVEGGKRVRPVMMLEWVYLCGGDIEKALPFACALEMIHSYSLVHDDMPCMDDSPLRHGKTSVHKKFGEDIGLLTGDALLNRAFEVCLAPENREGLDSDAVLRATALLAECAGIHGMIGGQMMDLKSEGKRIPFLTLEKLHMKKTAALLRAACCMGVLLGGGDEEMYRMADQYGLAMGMCFQIVDDVLDVISNSKKLGKPIGGDQKLQKCTYVTLCGLDGAKQYASQRADEAESVLDPLGKKADDLRYFTQKLLMRTR